MSQAPEHMDAATLDDSTLVDAFTLGGFRANLAALNDSDLPEHDSPDSTGVYTVAAFRKHWNSLKKETPST